MFENKQNENQEKIDNALDKLKEKYGYDFIKRGTDIEK